MLILFGIPRLNVSTMVLGDSGYTVRLAVTAVRAKALRGRATARAGKQTDILVCDLLS
jgi:hypothetical protein